MDSGPDTPDGVGCPIRTSADQRSLASPRGFSQRATSFVASWRLGIHRSPFSRSGSLPPPPACRTKPRPRARRPAAREPWSSANPRALALTLSNYTTNSGFTWERAWPGRCIAPAGPVSWKRSRAGRRAEATRPAQALLDARTGIEHPPHAPIGQARHEQDAGAASREERGARRGRSLIGIGWQPACIRTRPRRPSLKGGDPAAGSPTATLLRLHPSR